ncbi:MAG: hypothetical protein ABEH83_10925, partial [Halobacterium sp.]
AWERGKVAVREEAVRLWRFRLRSTGLRPRAGDAAASADAERTWTLLPVSTRKASNAGVCQ